ncbi:tetrathionate reductase subunit A [Vibrio crassostreae]|uniref:Tetrathionate reductase subunit A n=1 Tax=Vibrio crassostreae TaxID=246167 RepID=A0ABM9QTZ0_9VIBR|nr:tetrathionate reductase subunit A [Vibrio crassostreae]ROS63528.1 tetrathionate reductase alpha subunit precursor [Vibrio crassostreae]TCL29193.1 tetrathionate reductase alpha subunit precursor [Vibrio crassostreae]TCT51961.1 tetrathionate reductase alpha subunit precursor [Vibrio crassostreae]TCT60588.1 tetrathionate reductase alpha subunit precursor [Vibrio crassostreae]CAK1837519.1 Tetrathionate reductase subunit A [Vibrio crassostreae]
MDNKRRQFLKTGLAAGGVGAFAAGYATTIKHMVHGAIDGTAGKKTNHIHHGNSLETEYSVDEQRKISPNPNQRVAPSMCFGCWTLCGLRVRIDNRNDEILRISGNPYHPLSSDQQIPFKTPVKNAYIGLSGESGINNRSTACARGNGMLEIQNSPYRITQPLKRVGKRGEGKWEPISYEQLITEITEGGDLFGEGEVEGLRSIRDIETPLDPNNPEYGPKANQLLVTNAGNEGRDDILKRFAFNSYGTRNFGHHGSYCGYAFRAGSGAIMNDLDKFSHLKPDFNNAEFILFIGMSPAQAGNPFKRQARQLAEARTNGKLSYTIVTPSLPAGSSSLAAGDRNNWLPIKPGTDSALVLGMIQWIIENQRYNHDFLSRPSAQAMKKAGTTHWCNASHLVISDETHPQNGRMLRASDIGLIETGEPMSDDDGFIALDVTTSLLSSHIQVNEAALFVDQDVEIDGQTVRVKSSLQRLKEEAFKYDLAYYSEQCEIPQDQIIALAKRFTSYGTKAVVDTHGGNMHTNGFYNSFSILMLNALIGNINAKGGAMAKAGGYPTSVAGPRYDFTKFKGKTKPQGVFLSRSKFPYHKTSEYKRRVTAGESPYPTRAPWYPISAPLLTEHLSAAIDGYPYRAKAWINHMANPLYGVPGLDNLLGEKLKDPKQLGLIVSIDAFINETTALSDYLVPDTVTYESWGMATPWHGVATKAITARWPIVEPKTSRTQDGRAINLENFFIDLAKTLGLGGFGDNVIKDSQGNWHGIHSAEDFYLRSAANLAFVKGGVPNVDAEDIVWSGLERLVPVMNKTLKPEEILKVAYIFARGGRFEDATNAYTNETMKYKWTKPLAIWNEKLGTSRNTISGEQYMGCPTWYPQKLADGTPLAEQFPTKEWPFTLTNFKSNIHSAVSNLSPRLESIKGVNPVYIHPQDASSAGIKTGDVFAIETPSSTTHALAMVIDGIKQGTLGFEHGFGHKELGERAHWIGDTQQPLKMKSNDGVNINDIGLIDPTREGKGVMLDWVVGAAARQALPAKIYKV